MIKLSDRLNIELKEVISLRREIKAIRVNTSINATTENIYRVLLANDEEQSINLVKARIEAGVSYFYINQRNEAINLEMSCPIYKEHSIRSNNYDGVYDSIMDLPHF